ncbi:glycosyl hydrolase family 18 protein [Nostoc punctiforme UO1]|uniref:glycosyl hydrolase family 18 protein n=1 Tax=Nostoc punctiforme TaxID=272131 RepID=UPI0030B00CF7
MITKILSRNTSRLLVCLKIDKKLFLAKVVYFLFLSLSTVYFCLILSGSGEIGLAFAKKSEKTFVGYYQSWSEQWTSNPQQMQLANIAPYVNTVIVSFIQPDATYTKGSYNFAGTGLKFSADGKVVKDAITLLKTYNTKTKVLVAVGGQAGTNFAQMNPQAIANIVKDFGFDGVDIDYEPTNVKCLSSNGKVSCTSDAEFRCVVRQIRQVLPEHYLVTVAVWSIGAYGEGQWANAQPQGENTGMTLNLLRSPEGKMIDQLHIISYNAGTTYNLQETLAAYQNYFKGKVVMGVQVPPEAWGGNVYTLAKVRDVAQIVINRNAAGLMLWSLQKQVKGTPSRDNPTAEMIAKTACQVLLLGNCQQPLFSSQKTGISIH